MKTSRFAITMICAFCLVSTTVVSGEAATTLNGSTIIGVDQAKRTITFKTKAGETWTLPVADPNILKAEQVTTGKRVSIEIDLSDRITKVIQHFEPPQEYFKP